MNPALVTPSPALPTPLGNTGAGPVRPASGPAAPDALACGSMLLLCAVWSLQQISLKAVAAQASPMLVVALRSFVALLLLALLMRRQGQRLQRAHWRPGLLVGSLFAVEYLLVAQALQRTTASHVVLFLYSAPVFAALGLHLRVPAERLQPLQWLGIAAAFAGMGLAFGEAPAGASPGWQGLLGDGLALAAGAAWGATTVSLRCSALAQAPATETLFYQLAGAFALLGPAAWLTGQARLTLTGPVLAHLAFQSLVVSFASFLAWFWLLRRYLAAPLGVFSFLTPLFGVVLGAWLLHEPLVPRFIAGCALVFGGMALVNARPLLARLRGTAARPAH